MLKVPLPHDRSHTSIHWMNMSYDTCRIFKIQTVTIKFLPSAQCHADKEVTG